MKKRRIALLVPGFPEGGGVPAVALFLYDVLAGTTRYEPAVVSLAVSHADPSSVRALAPASWFRGIAVSQGNWAGRPYRGVGAFLPEFEFQRYRPRAVLTRILADYDLVQVVCGWPSWALPALEAGKPVGLQVATLVGMERQSARLSSRGLRRLLHPVMTRVLARMETVALKRVDRVFVENSWMFEHVSKIAGAARTAFAPPGIDTSLFSPPAQRALTGPILSVGRFADPRKNVALLFRAYALLVERMPAAPPLVLAGSAGPGSADLDLARSLGIASRIEIREAVSVADLVALYRQAALFALSSNEEGLGIVILEAMACGCPVVSTNCGGPATSVVEGRTGFLTPVGDAPAFAAALERGLSDTAFRTAAGTLARHRAVEHFSMAATGRRFLDWYDQVLGVSPGESAARPMRG